MAAQDKYITSDDANLNLPAGSITKRAQTFSAQFTYNCRALKLKISRVLLPGTITVKVYSGTDFPGTGSSVLEGTATYDGDTITTNSSGAWYTFDFGVGNEFSVSSGTQYWVLMETPSNGDASNYVQWRYDNGNGYSYGTFYYYFGSWSFTAANDAMFEMHDSLPGGTVYAEGTKTVTAAGTASLVAGPGKVTTPGPTDDQTNIFIAGSSAINAFTWVAPVGETPDYLVYFRASGGTWALQETITDNSTMHYLSVSVRSSLSYYSIYEWRVDTRDPDTLLITTGDTWTFITQISPSFTDFTRRSDYNADQVWQPGTGWVDINSFEFTGSGRYKGRIVIVGNQVIYFGDL